MHPDIFQPDASMGRLVGASFDRVRFVDGIPKTETEQGWAFIPGALPTLDEILPLLGPLMAKHERAVAVLGRLDGSFQDHPGGLNINPWVLYRPLRLREARLSSKIENTIASASEIEAANLLNSQRSEPREVRNYMTAIDRAVGMEGPLSEMRIRGLHEALLSGIEGAERKFPGQYRPKQVMIGDDGDSFADARFVPPPPGEVPALMHDLVEFMRQPPTGMPALIAAALAHYQFETIHPFADGNGRLGRMLITLSLCEGTILSKPLIYPSGYINQHKQRYYDLLLKVSTHADWASWIDYFLDAIISEAQGTIDRIRRLFTLRQNYIDRFQDKNLGIAFYSQIDYLFEQSVVSVNMIHERIEGTKQTARNYVDLLVERGVLTKGVQRGAEVYYFAPEIHQVADED